VHGFRDTLVTLALLVLPLLFHIQVLNDVIIRFLRMAVICGGGTLENDDRRSTGTGIVGIGYYTYSHT
jgi:hypothetical protein